MRPSRTFTRLMLVGLGLLCLAGATLRTSDAAAPEVAAASRVRQYVYDMESAYRKIRDYTAVMYKQERVKGTLQPSETIEVKFRKPLSVYLKWTGDVNPGQEAIYVAGWNDGQMRAHKGSFPDVTVNLKPTSSMAMRGNRHPITQAGFGHTIGLVAHDARRSEENPGDGVEYVDLGESTVHGAASRCLEQRVPSAAGAHYYAARARVCFDLRSRMPTRVTVWDAQDQLLEDYGYAKVKLDVGLTDLDFDPANPAYKF